METVMPVPLIWLGAGVAAVMAGNAMYKEHQKNSGVVGHYPGESEKGVKPVDGAVVTCGIFGVFDHTGIWVDDAIVELKGNGLVRGVSPERFVSNRSGERIYLACNSDGEPLVDQNAIARATEQLFTYSSYHVIDNNCHRFVWECISGQSEKLTRFAELNQALHRHFGEKIYWCRAEV